MRKNSVVDDGTLTQRALSWDTSIPELVARTLEQWCEPLERVVGPANKAAVLGILYEAAVEHHQHRPLYHTFIAHDPLTVRHAALTLADEVTFQAYVYLEASRRLVQELRRLRLISLGYTASTSFLDSLEQQQERLQQEQAQHALLHARPKRVRKPDPAFEALFDPRVSVPALLTALQRNAVLTAELAWEGRSGKANELMALLAVLEEGGYLRPLKWTHIVRGFITRFQLTIPVSYASKRNKANPQVMAEFAQLFPGRYLVRTHTVRWRH